jgi:outer membrane protein insertion porin family
MALAAPKGVAGQATNQPVHIDSIAVEGNQRISRETILNTFGVAVGSNITYRDLQHGIKDLYATGDFTNVQVRALGTTPPIVLVLQVQEQPLMDEVDITGLEHASPSQARDTTGLKAGTPYNEQKVMDAEAFIRKKLATEGIPFAKITEHKSDVPGHPGEIRLVLDVDEGNRVTIADVNVTGNKALTDAQIVAAMDTKPEGFLWYKEGTFQNQNFQGDVADRIPALYHAHGYLDFKILSDTVIVDPQTGKARAEIAVDEGPQYRLKDFTIEGNTRFPTEQLKAYFEQPGGGLLHTLGLKASEKQGEGQVFDEVAFNDALQQVHSLYANEGYIYAQANPVIKKNPPAAPGEQPTVDAEWRITEGAPAIVNRVNVTGNDYTYDWVVRNRISVIPGDVYSQDRVLQSYRAVSALGFFETPMPLPDIQPTDNGDVDITFKVKEKQTGSINFGTSVGGGVGLSGFLGYDQPNLFGQAKSGSIRWDFGKYLNTFELGYTDPALFQSRISGSLSLYNSRDRFYQFATGQRKRMGFSLRFGFPWLNSMNTRLFMGYSLSRTKYELFQNASDASLFGRPPGVQSQVSLALVRSTLDQPLFPTVGSRQSLTVETNGGILGGDGNYTRTLLEGSWWVPTGQLGSSGPGSRPVRFALGLTMHGGAVFGDASAFPFDRFWMGGVQFGQPLRGYNETTITPLGYYPQGSTAITDIQRLGNAYFSLTAEEAMRLTDQVSLSAFYDAGNVWRTPQEIDPTKLFRGAGIGVELVTPFGPIGLDYAYGFDKDVPGWQLHFRMGGAGGAGGGVGSAFSGY